MRNAEQPKRYLGLLRDRGKRGLPSQARLPATLQHKPVSLSLRPHLPQRWRINARRHGVKRLMAHRWKPWPPSLPALRQERYQWQPAQTNLRNAKRNGKKRPLGMPVWSDKLLAVVMRMILDAYFDGTFSEHSHGFREGRGCHTALQDIYHTWKGSAWIIEGDIAELLR